MSKKSTKEEFIIKAMHIHGDLYNYDQVIYNTNYHKVKILCKIDDHGYFYQSPNAHLKKQACPICGDEKKGKYREYTTESYIKKICETHKDKDRYLYDQVIYTGLYNKIKIYCKIHKCYFEQVAQDHLSGCGCHQCGRLVQQTFKVKSLQTFIEEAVETHGDLYSYDKTIYVNSHAKVTIYCKKHKCYFEQLPGHHIGGCGCQICGKAISKPELEWLNFLEIPDDKEHRQVHIFKTNKMRVDGFDPTTNTCYEYNGSFFHGNPRKYKAEEYNKMTKCNFGELYQNTLEKEKLIKEAGYNLVTMWEDEWEALKKKEEDK